MERDKIKKAAKVLDTGASEVEEEIKQIEIDELTGRES